MDLPNNSIAQSAETQHGVTPVIALEMLKRGNARFTSGNPLNRDYDGQIRATSGGQWPFAVVLSCIDSRVPAETVFDQGIGDIFSVRVAGNFVNPDILGSIEYSCAVAGSKLVVVMGHTSCGAVKGATDAVELGNITQMLNKIMPAVRDTVTFEGEARNSSNADFVNNVSVRNVELNIERIKSESPVLKGLLDDGKIDIIGAMYDVGSGVVTFYAG